MTGLVATPDERALWADGTQSAWLIDPAHPQGYTQIHFRSTSEVEVHTEGITRIGLSTTGRCILAARDGGVAWTTADMRIAKERFLAESGRSAQPLDVAGDERWVYVLRGRGLLQRFLIDQPKPKKKEERPGRARAKPTLDEEEEPLPEALSCRLSRPAECMTLAVDAEGNKKLVFGGSTADGYLGRAWTEDPERLEWSELRLGKRQLVDPADEPGSQAPSFTPTKSKLEGSPVRDLKVDEVISGKTPYWSSTDHGVLLDRPAVAAGAAEILPGDSLLLPAMIRFKEGTARPAILVWPGVADERREVPRPIWLTWGDQSAGWVVLETLDIRKQRWSRSDLFPLQVALASTPPEAPGRRFRIPERWADPEAFAALARECKKLLKVLW